MARSVVAKTQGRRSEKSLEMADKVTSLDGTNLDVPRIIYQAGEAKIRIK